MTKFTFGIGSFFLAMIYAFPANASSALDYWAKFQWRDGKEMQLIIKEGRKEKSHRPIAYIRQNGRTIASCAVKPFDPSSIEMTCTSAGFSPLTSHATLYMGERQGRKVAILRFGTWLAGYQQAALEVKVDRSARLTAPVKKRVELASVNR